ncbi:DUF1538 domain-containing protein [Aquiflexum sp. LQ15W]|uniref:DUF1538 family protein n=1 Tax=Cognataquiflexum nitidum TaxID=2922272 RepID=UPI001F139485|nr:DUF1538 domain-containing protein [Cognataquiflexum nitidum]MCH6201861.1 DUF1538 domain-containing protein [Cognataquiflexum nitidum]
MRDPSKYFKKSYHILKYLFLKLRSAFMDLLPILSVVTFFQLVILRQPFPHFEEIIFGSIMVLLGLMLFIEGLEMGLFPIGGNMAFALTKKGSVFWILIFSFALGFSTTIAEPALIAISKEAARVSAEAGLIENAEGSRDSYALGLRLCVAFSVGIAILIGVLRILKGWPLYYILIGGYILVVIMTMIAPKEIIGIAYDTGGVATSTITVPLVTALGVGLASSIKGRNPLTDGFGLIAIAVMVPMIFVMAYGLFIY